MTSVITSALASRRLGTAPTEHRLCFTVDRAEALQRQRHRPGSTRWSWTLQVLRALFALTDGARFIASPPQRQTRAGLRLRFSFDPSPLTGISASKLLEAALEPDAGPGDGSIATRQRRFVRLLARGINESLAFGPCRVDVRIGRRVHRFEVADGGKTETEQVDEVVASAEIDAWPLEIEVVIDRLVGRWFEIVLGNDGFQETLRLWFARVPGLDLSVEPGVLRPVPLAPPLRFGVLGAWWPENHPLALLRDGVLLETALGRSLGELGVPIKDFLGSIEAPALRLTFDEASVVLDAEISRLVAWLADVRAHASRLPLPFTSEEVMYYGAHVVRRPRRYEGRIIGATWPTNITHVATVSGEWIAVATLVDAARDGREVAYCWTHERAATPEHLRSSTLMLWPRELEQLQRIANLRLVPVAALDVAAISDWGALVQVSFPELALGTIARSSEIPVRIDVAALVHRRREAAAGRIELALRGSVVADIRDPRRVLPGVVLVGRVVAFDPATRTPGPAVLQAALRAIEIHGRTRIDIIAAHAREHTIGVDDDAPLLRAIAEHGEDVLATPAIEATRRSPTATTPCLRVDVALQDYEGALHLVDSDHVGVVEVWCGGQSCGAHTLAPPWTRAAGDLRLRAQTTPFDTATLERLVVYVMHPEIRRVWPLAAPRSSFHRSLAELAVPLPEQAPPLAPRELPMPAPEDITLQQALCTILDRANIRFAPTLSSAPATFANSGVIRLGVLCPWVVEAVGDERGREVVSLAAMNSLFELFRDTASFEIAVLRHLALFRSPA